MANEKVSQLTSLTALEISPEDVFLVGDISARESKKITADELLTFVEESGSINAVTSVTSQTASYVAGANVSGTVTSSSFTNVAISSSWASRSGNATSASYAATASYIGTTTSLIASASFLVYSANNGSASYAVKSNTSDNSTQASFLVWSANNGSSSFATRSFFATSASYSTAAAVSVSSSYSLTSSFVASSSYAKSSSVSTTASYALSSTSPIKAWAMVTWSYGASVSQPSLYYHNNISSIKYITNHFDSPLNWVHFGIIFENDLSSTEYILQGNAARPYGGGDGFFPVVIHPVYSNRTITTCTMSVPINTTVISVANFFNSVSSSYPNGENAYLTFQVLGN